MPLDELRTVPGVRIYSTLVGGYVENRGGWCRHCHGRMRRQVIEPNLRFVPDNYPAIIARHEDWVLHPDQYSARREAPGAPVAAPGGVAAITSQPRTLAELWDLYEADHPAMKASKRAKLRTALGAVLTRSVSLERPPETVLQELRDLVRTLRDNADLAPTTRAKYLSTFSWWVRHYVMVQGYVSGDPVTLVGKVHVPRARGGALFSEDEIAEIVGRLKRRHHVAYGVLVRVLARTGVRPGELVHIARRDVTNDSMRVYPKGHLEELATLEAACAGDWPRYWNERDVMIERHELPYRVVPVALIPGLAGDLDALRAMEYPSTMARYMLHGRHQHFLFPWSNFARLREAFNDACDNPKPGEDRIVRGARTLYTLRDTAIDWWRHALGWPVELRTLVAGHSEAVYARHYRIAPTAQQLAAMVTR